VGNAYLPDGFNNTRHAEQRAVGMFAGMAGRNLAAEFAPDIGRALHGLHLPRFNRIPVWWTSK
jgi:hypothetical protein